MLSEGYGRNRQSIDNIEEKLANIFEKHPDTREADNGELYMPADSLPSLFRDCKEAFGGVEILNADEIAQLKAILDSNPGLNATPQMLLQLFASRTNASPEAVDSSGSGSNDNSLTNSPAEVARTLFEDDNDSPDRGRSEERSFESNGSRSSSRSSIGTSVYRPPSRQSMAPHTPSTRKAFDKRRRSYQPSAPSSWSRPAGPAHNRRRSDVGMNDHTSDSEYSASPGAYFSRSTGSRSRGPSIPASPSSSSASLSVGVSPSPGSSISRPSSRGGYHSHSSFTSPGVDYGPPSPSPDGSDLFSPSGSGISSLPMPRMSMNRDNDSDDGEDSDNGVADDDPTMAMNLSRMRSFLTSTSSAETEDRVEALTRQNTDLKRKLMDAERTLQQRLQDHDMEMEEMQGKLDEVRLELSATKREEKELRSKERQNLTQIATLESEIAKLQKSLENARQSYMNLQKQYSEQCAEAERYRTQLRRRVEEAKDLQDAANLQALEIQKLTKEREDVDVHTNELEEQLEAALSLQVMLEEQKQENMLLKETIDRMKYDMDEMRNKAQSGLKSGHSSMRNSMHMNSLGRSLGAELAGKLADVWGMTEGGEEQEGDEGVEIDDELDEEGTEGEDVVETIITRKTRRIGSRANRIVTQKFEDSRTLCDAYTQYEPEEFHVSGATQTDPEPKIITASIETQTENRDLASFAIQTDPVLPPPSSEMDIQTDPSPIAHMEIQTDPELEPEPEPLLELAEMEIQTEPEPVPEPTPVFEMSIQTDPEPIVAEMEVQTEDHQDHLDEDTLLASSSSATIVAEPSSSKILSQLPPPPAYSHEDMHQHDLLVVEETLKKWHPGVHIPIKSHSAALSNDAIEEWNALKEELGIECTVVDDVIATSSKTGRPRPSKEPKPSSQPPVKKGWFYNIYRGEDGAGFSLAPAGQLLLCIGASAAVFVAMSPMLIPHRGGPTYYDRHAWGSFNSMHAAREGLSPDGTALVWNFLGRIGGGAARIVQGRPT